MRVAAILGSLLSLAIVLLLQLMHLGGHASAWAGQLGITLGTIGWFACAPFWLARPNGDGIQ